MPEKIQRRESSLQHIQTSEKPEFPAEIPSTTPQFVAHEDNVYYFDYGAVRFGPKPVLEDPDQGSIICVGFGWLPGWEFTINEQGLPNIVPIPARLLGKLDTAEEARIGVLGLLYQLLKPGQSLPKRSKFLKTKTPDVVEVVSTSVQDWTEAVPFHATLKVPKPVRIYIHLCDGGIGHKYQRDGKVVPFRTPDWPVKAVVHVDPEKPRVTKEKPKLAVKQLQGGWVSRELGEWTKEVRLPREYVDEILEDYISTDVKPVVTVTSKTRRIRKFLGFR